MSEKIIFLLILLGLCFCLLGTHKLINKLKGCIDQTAGFIHFDGLDPSKFSKIYLYPNKITINDIQSIPIEHVKNATSYVHSEYIRRTSSITRNKYFLSIEFINKDGDLTYIKCQSTKGFHQVDYMVMARSINKHIRYIPEKPNYPDKPYEL